MAIARTGVYIDDYFEDASTLPAELQRLLNTIRELDDRSQAMIKETGQQTKYWGSRKGSNSQAQGGYGHEYDYEEEESASEKLLKGIEANQDNALSLCTEKVLLAQQAYDLVDSHIKRLDEDLNNFAEDLKHVKKRKITFGTPTSLKRPDYWDRERGRDFELMPPPGSHKRAFAASADVDQPIDPDEPTYCVCHQVSFGDMIACDNENCQGGEWFHYSCVGLTPETRFKGKWFCPTCRFLPHMQFDNGIVFRTVEDLSLVQWERKPGSITQNIVHIIPE